MTQVVGSFEADDAVEVVDGDGLVVAKGLSRVSASRLAAMAGRRSEDLVEGEGEVVHRDDLVVLPT